MALTATEKKELAAAATTVARLSRKLQTPAKKPTPASGPKKAGAVRKAASKKGGAQK